MSSGYSGTPLEKKLGLQPGMRICLLHEPRYYRALFSQWPSDMSTVPEPDDVDLVHYFASGYEPFAADLPILKNGIRKNGMIWISWPKKSSRQPTDLTEDRIRDLALQSGLVDVKVCSVDETWSALKLVIPLKSRQ